MHVAGAALDGPTVFAEEALDLLCQGEYAGNGRQLEGIVLSAYLLARHRGGAKVEVVHLPPEFYACAALQAAG